MSGGRSHDHHEGCGVVHGEPQTRRDALRTMGAGFGMMAFAHMVGASMLEAASPIRSAIGGIIPKPHFAPRAKNVIFLFMNGGVSQVDTIRNRSSSGMTASRSPPARSRPNGGRARS